MKKLLKFIPKITFLMTFMALVPMVAFADTSCSTATGLTGMICTINGILSSILPVLVALGVIYFVWGMVQYFIGDGEEAKKNGRERIIYAIIGLAVIIGMWGLVNILTVTFGIANSTAPSGLNINGSAGSSCSGLTSSSTFQNFLGYIVCIINSSVIPLIFALAVVMFIWGVVKFTIINANEEAKREEGRQYMLWGIIALAVMLSVWGLVGILGGTFNIGVKVLPQVCPPGATNC